jgi:hypothetical protein
MFNRASAQIENKSDNGTLTEDYSSSDWFPWSEFNNHKSSAGINPV